MSNTSSDVAFKANDLVKKALAANALASNDPGSVAASKAKAVADLENLGVLKEAFDFFDEDNSGGLYGDQLIRCLEAVDVRFDDCSDR